MDIVKDKILGSMVGGAVGDALGYPVEFMGYNLILARYGSNGITGFEFDCKDIAGISDDTQMTLYTAEGLLYAIRHDRPIVALICNSYMYWLGPQIGKKIKGAYPSDLIKIEELNQNRAPGNTCLSSLEAIYSGYEPSNNSKGCGGIMRIAPIALYGAAQDWPLEKTAKLAGEVAEITHLHQMSTLASACCAAIIQQCVAADSEISVDVFRRFVSASLECLKNLYHDFSCQQEFCNLINKVFMLLDSPDDDWQIIERELGGGWVAEETLAIAIFSVARHISSFADCVICAVNHGGDSDSTGAVAGNIMGAIVGRNAIPAKYTYKLQLHDLIESTAIDLATVKK